MGTSPRVTSIPAEALIRPTLMVTGRSAAPVYAQSAAELTRLTKAGALIKIARGYYAAVPIHQRGLGWAPSIEDLAAGLASAVYGHGNGAVWGLSAARLHGALPRAISVGYACGPSQHQPIRLLGRAGVVQFAKREVSRLDVEYVNTELGPGLVTSPAQTILDLSTRPFEPGDNMRAEAVRNLMDRVDPDELTELASRSRGRAALKRARDLAAHGH